MCLLRKKNMTVHGSYNSYLESDEKNKISLNEQHKTSTTTNLHFIEVGNFGDINQVHDGKIFHFLCNAVQNFIHFHARRVPIMTESNNL